MLAGCETGDDNHGDDDDASPGGDDDDNNDDDTSPPGLPTLDLVFVDPIYWLDVAGQDMVANLDAMKAQGIGGVIWRWTYRLGKTTYPSEAFTPFLDMTMNDPVETLLTLADERGLQVVLGLSAGQEARDYYLDPVGPEFDRNATLIAELAARYGRHASLTGFYVPYEYVPTPDENDETLLMLIAQAVHEQRADWRTFITIRYPGFPQYRVPFHIWTNHLSMAMYLDALDDGDYREAWGNRVMRVLDAAGIDVALISTRMGSRHNDLAGAIADRDTLWTARDALGADVALWTQVDLYDALGDSGGGIRTAFGPLDQTAIDAQLTMDAEGRAGFLWDYWRNSDGALRGVSFVPEPELFDKAERVREHLIGKTPRDRQLVTVINGQFPLPLFHNVWQEDACWLTGLYLAAESFRYAVLVDEDSKAAARATWQALRKMADVTPKRGEVVRNWTTYLYDQTNPVEPGADTIKRWHKHPDDEVYWVGDISVDQLSGYFYGLTTFYDLVADEAERAQVRETVDAVMGDILDHDFHAVQFDGQPTTYGNLRAAPELAGAFTLIAYHITSNARYLDAFNQLTYDEFMDIRAILYHWAMHYVAHKYGGQHFQDSAYAHLFEYLDDPVAFHRWIWALEYVYQGSYLFGNSYANFTHQMHVPDSAGAARALGELYRFDPDLLDNGMWFQKVNETWPTNEWVDMNERPAAEFMWGWTPWGDTRPRGGPNHRYPGPEFLLVYWQGRYMGWIR
jgi:hypothetical protein